MTRPGLLLATLLLSAVPAAAQVAYPPRPDKYDVQFRYRIRAGRDERIRQFREMERFLKDVGFVATPREGADLDAFDPTAEMMDGTMPPANAARLFEDPRIQTAVFVPAGRKLSDDPATPVQVRLILAGGLAPEQQRLLHEQVSRHLGLMGFREGVGYDTLNGRLLRGSLPVGYLFTLLKDLRNQPSGWFAPAVPPESLPLPLRSVLPVRLVEVLPDLPAGATPPPPPANAPARPPKFTPELAALLADPAAQERPLRVDLILENDPQGRWQDVRFSIRTAAEGTSIEGLVGSIVSVRVAHGRDVLRLAEQPFIRHVRLPSAGSETAMPLAAGAAAPNPADVLAASRVADLLRIGYRGQGTRVAVVASEFPGVLGMVGRQLPATTRVIDLTAELSPDLLPNPADPNRPGVGTVAALAASAAAPAAEVMLVRVDPTALHQLMTVARAASGDPSYSEAMQSRSQELISRAEALTTRRTLVTEQYRRAFTTLSDQPAAVRARQEARAALDQLVADERTYNAAVARFTALKDAVDSLRGSAVVVNTLVWDTGFPQDGLSALSRLLEERFQPRPARSALQASRAPTVPIWVQAASTAVGQVWAGPYRDADDNGALEFAPPDAALPKGRWSRELNFLGFEPAGGKAAAALPAGLKLRFTVQWREPRIDAGVLTREPAFPFTIRLLRQLDTEGKTIASDELVEVARSVGAPVRLLETAGSAAYEQSMEVTVPADGVYALRLESGYAIEGLLPALRRGMEFSPRVVVEPADPASAAKGTPVFQTYPTINAGVGVPGESPAAVTVGILGPNGESVGTLTGAGPGIALRVKPDLLTTGVWVTDGGGASGSAVSAAYAAGVAASLRSAGVRVSDMQRSLSLDPGRPLVLPTQLLSNLSTPRPGSER
ncbi:MAG TPA: hypothetical protein VFG68_15725 [Fimbriiglobus sp.]|nr:hypothetical protein [Fimbriiglobus sp.]